MLDGEYIRTSWGVLDIASLMEFAIEDGVRGNIEYYRLPISLQLLSYNDGFMSWFLPKNYFVRRYCEVIEIKTHSSRKIRCTADSTIITIDENLNFKKVLPKIGLSIPRYTPGHNANAQDHDITLPFRDERENKYLWKSCLTLNHDLGWLIGIYIGDGWTGLKSRNNAVILSSVYPDIVEEVKRIVLSYLLEGDVTFFKQKYPHSFRGKPSYSEKLIFSSRSWATFIASCIGHGAANKHLPEFWQVAGEGFRWGLLAGLIDSDGTVSINRTRLQPNPQILFRYDTISETLAQEVAELGHSLGLVGTIGFVKTPLGNDAYIVTFNKDSIDIISRKLILITRKYNDILCGFKMGNKRNVHIYSPVISKERLLELRKEVGVIDLNQNKEKARNIAPAKLEKIKNRNRLYSAISRVIYGRDGCRGAIIRETAMEITKLDLDIFKQDEFWIRWKRLVLNMDFSYEIITSIKPLPAKRPTYGFGFDIPDSHSIVTGSGFLL